jgi:hypothetical protein
MELQIHYLIATKLLLETFYMNLSHEIYGKHLYKYTGSCNSLTMIHEGSTGTPPPPLNGLVLGPTPAGGHVRNLQTIVKHPNLLAMLVFSLPQIALDSHQDA